MTILWHAFGWCCCIGLFLLSVVAVAALGGGLDPRLDVLTHFAPIYLGLGVMGLLLAPVLGGARRFVAGIPALIIVLAGGALVLPELRSVDRSLPGAASPADLKIIQFNALASNRVKEGAAAWLIDQDPDIIVLEEPGGLERLVARTGNYKRVQGSLSTVILAKAMPVGANSILWPLPRILSPVTVATLSDQRGDYAVIGIHRPWPMNIETIARQEAYLQRMVRSFGPETTIVVGDFNSAPWSFDRRREDRTMGLTRRTRALFSWPADRVSHNRFPVPIPAPLLPIDHVYAGAGWRTVSVERGPRLGSDHYPVIVVLTPAGPEGRLPTPRRDGDARLTALAYKRPARD
jgi:endonuclease/exonuclease/phosphatase (EEP) superfamily protein YafD